MKAEGEDKKVAQQIPTKRRGKNSDREQLDGFIISIFHNSPLSFQFTRKKERDGGE